ncbi:MAG: hypothetical protein ACE141_03995 [Bryobacteraceae bacterium]
MALKGNRALAGVLLLASLSARAAEAADTRIVVAILDYADVPPETLELAKAQTSKIYGKAGVEIEWKEAQALGEAATARPAVRPAAWVKLLPNSMAKRLRRTPGAFGCALDNQVYVFAERVRETAKHARISYAKTLGHIMAHEIGHILLGADSHAPRSIMSPFLGPVEFQEMEMGHLLFNEAQAEQLSGRLLAQR